MTNQRVQAKNDAFRKTVMFAPHPDGKAVMTPGVASLGSSVCAWIYKQIAEFDDFTEDNDPYGDHDFGSIQPQGLPKIFWKIDYYEDADMEYGAEDKLNAYRVLVIMLSEEY